MTKIRPAHPEELASITPLVACAVAHMNQLGNPQWDASYPAPAHYREALEDGTLYVALNESDTLLGAAVFNTVQAPEYTLLPWSRPGPALVIHKLVVHPAAQRQGVASALFSFAAELGHRQGLGSIRIDTYTRNDRMQALILKQGFVPVGHVHFDRLPLPYPCFELLL